MNPLTQTTHKSWQGVNQQLTLFKLTQIALTPKQAGLVWIFYWMTTLHVHKSPPRLGVRAIWIKQVVDWHPINFCGLLGEVLPESELCSPRGQVYDLWVNIGGIRNRFKLVNKKVLHIIIFVLIKSVFPWARYSLTNWLTHPLPSGS